MYLCNHTVTLVRHIAHRSGDEYACEVIVGVSWHGRRGDAPSASAGEAPRDCYTVRIPNERVPEELPQAGDIMVLGILAEYAGRKSLEGREWFRVSSVSDNRRGKLLPHVTVRNT